jgi:hypothetical protein
MENKKITINTDALVHYFMTLTMDLWVAYAVLIVGIVALILSFII